MKLIPVYCSPSASTSLLLGLFAFVVYLPAWGDIVGPVGKPQSVQTELVIPESLLVELDRELAEQLRPAAESYLRSRNVDELKVSYNKIAEGTDSLPTFEVFQAKLFSAFNLLGDSLGVLEKYTIEHPDDPEAHITLGAIAAKSGRFVDAWLQLLYAQRLLDREKLPAGRIKYVQPMIIELRASVAEQRKQWVEAEQLFRKLQELKSDSAQPLWRAGRVKVLAGEIQLGYEVLQQAYQQDNKLLPPALSVAQTLHDMSDWVNDPKNAARVENWYKKAVKDSADNPAAWASYFKWLILADRPQDVALLYDQLSDSLKAKREIGLMRGVAARYLNELDTAETILSAAHQSDSDDIEIADQLALVLIESTDEGKRAKALKLAERNARAAPQSEMIMATIAWVQFRLGAQDVAQNIFSQLISRGNWSPQTTYYLAEVMEKSGQIEESNRLRKSAIKSPGIFPQRAQVKARLGVAE